MLDVKMLCLATLMAREASGYDIKKDLERGSAAGMIEASFGSIYPALSRLADEGLITARAEGGRGRGDKKMYSITSEGVRHFLKTLSGPLEGEKYRSPFMFAMLFAEGLPRERVRGMIDSHLQAWAEKLDLIEDPLPPGVTGGAGLGFVQGIARTMLHAGIDYIRTHRETIEAAARVRSPAVPETAATDRPAGAASSDDDAPRLKAIS